VFDGVLPAQAMRILSWPAEGLAEEKQSTKRIKHNQILRRIWLAFFQQDVFCGMATDGL